MLYCGLAFFEYDDGRFWPEFSRVVGTELLPADINEQFERCANHFEIRLRHHTKNRDYVGSAIYLAGMPVTVWGDFLPLCDWALCNQGWGKLSDDDWEKLANRRCGGHKRLKRFITGNRDLATAIMKEMIALRQRFVENPNSAAELLDANGLIRPEYFEEVPETAEFLSPKHPERLNRERVGLALNMERRIIYLRVPGIKNDKLPAKWKIGETTKPTEYCAGQIALNSAAFLPQIPVELVSSSGDRVDRRLLIGISPWAIFDLDDDGTMINPKRIELPTRRYALISNVPLDKIVRRGFSEEDCPANDPFELSDGTKCYMTILDPNEERASLTFHPATGDCVNVKFRPRERIEYHFLPTHGLGVACFRREGGVFYTQSLPTVCLSVPPNFFNGADTTEQLTQAFKVRFVRYYRS